MKSRRGKRIALVCAALVLTLLAVSGVAFRERLLEYWYLHRLDSDDAGVRETAVRQLGVLGTRRAVPTLLDIAEDEESLRVTAAESLESIFSRATAGGRAEIARGLIRVVKAGGLEAAGALRRIGPQAAQALPLFAAELTQESVTLRLVAAAVLFEAWPESKSALSDFLSRAGVTDVERFFLSLRDGSDQTPARLTAPLLSWRQLPEMEFFLPPTPERILEVAAYFARYHVPPRARALSLSFALFRGKEKNELVYDLDLLSKVFESDTSSTVRRAALRIAGFLGDCPGNLNLRQLILHEKDPELLLDAIQARHVWSADWVASAQGFEFLDGTISKWIPLDTSKRVTRPWDDEELARLEEILWKEKHPQLRDAASLVLAARFRGAPPPAGSSPQAVRAPAFEMHEWGVWSDAGDTMTPAHKMLEELPSIVHRAEIPAADLWSQRFHREPIFIRKPVLFFYSPKPVTALVQVSFFEGRPWTFYPEATDQLLTVRQLSAGHRSAPPPFEERKGLSPEGLVYEEEASETRERIAASRSRRVSSRYGPRYAATAMARIGSRRSPGRGEVDYYYRTVPWLVPKYPSTPWTRDDDLAGVGLEWCGLRVGYGEELEGKPADVPPGSWWHHLRQVPSTPIAVRGEHERFLFYDGSVNAPSPLLVAWKDGAREDLLLKARSCDVYPEPWQWNGGEWERLPVWPFLPGAIVIRKRPGAEPEGKMVEDILAEEERTISLDDLVVRGGDLVTLCRKALVRQGLTEPEAESLLRAWEPEFLATDGLRVLTILPRWLYDAVLPLYVQPAPEEVVRVGLIWRECDKLPVGKGSSGPDWSGDPCPNSEVRVTIEKNPLPPLERRRFDGLSDARMGGQDPAVSEDGRVVAYRTHDPEKHPAIFVARLDAKERLVVGGPASESIESVGPPTLSADGNRVAFACRESGEWFVRVADRNEKTLVEIRWGSMKPAGVCLSARGRHVAFGSRGMIWVVDLERGMAREVVIGGSSFDAAFQLSADGRRVAFSWGAENAVAGRSQIRTGRGAPQFAWRETSPLDAYVLDLDAEAVLINVSGTAGVVGSPSLSADGRWLVFVSARGSNRIVYVADLEERSVRRLTRHGGDDALPALSADGGRLAFVRDGRLRVLDLRSGEVVPVDRRGSPSEPIAAPAISGDGRRVVHVEKRKGVLRFVLTELGP